MSAIIGKTVDLDKVLLIADDEDKVTIGTPTIEGAKVVATAKGEGKDKKVTIFKYKAKTRYRKKRGHRQPFTQLSIDNIVLPGTVTEDEPVKKTRVRKKKEVTESGS